ncbi:hypothetical protein [Mucilaginibacter sp. KACC 22063]|uniref:hypothetical protein n=1 Tax=Mucilaginibacter sp. KACC 22063 TaxID=3025666 RepID=UPI00236649C9|nr:hypothetical protein [Mucilaginibacter sp. KACC 22063]WDF55779.1 hypothetical protein PQ461_01725 [Mucilaginibacter sp. KACC 22063]
MSIFPKRTRRGKTVTIHWNFNTAHLFDQPVYPLVRIGVTDPLGNTSMLMEDHVLTLPSVCDEENSKPGQALHLNKNLPLMVMADYLSGKQTKERLVEILQNIQSGRHYYWHYQLPADAPLGKYTLLSEVISEGQIRLSKTAADDHFFVEELEITEEEGVTIAYNPSPEKLPVKVIDYVPGKRLTPDNIQVFELAAGEKRRLNFNSRYSYITYNEEREMLPLRQGNHVMTFKNAAWLRLDKPGKIYLFHRSDELAYELTPVQQLIWLAADGVRLAEELNALDPDAYDELLAKNIINEQIN